MLHLRDETSNKTISVGEMNESTVTGDGPPSRKAIHHVMKRNGV